METVSIKLEEDFASHIEQMRKKHHYTTKTEFIREAIRDKIKTLEKEFLLQRLKSKYGASKKRTTDAELHKARESAFDEV